MKFLFFLFLILVESFELVSPTNNSTTTVGFNSSAILSYAELVCPGYHYPTWETDDTFLQGLRRYFDTPLALLSMLLSTIIVLITIIGKIEGSFKYCVMNIAIFHFMFPFFGKVVVDSAWAFILPDSATLGMLFTMNMVLNAGTVGLVVAIAGSLPLSLNRFLLIRESALYDFVFKRKLTTFFFLVSYDIILFAFFYTLYAFSYVHMINSNIYYILTIGVIATINLTSFFLMLYVLYRCYSSIQQVKKLEQQKLVKEKKQIAWVIFIQIIINFLLLFFRVVGYYNIARMYALLPMLFCYNIFFNISNSFFIAIQELLVCIDCMIYIFFLSQYREKVVKFLKIITRRYKIKIPLVSVTNSRPMIVNQAFNK